MRATTLRFATFFSLLAALGLMFSACGGGGSSPEERACGAVDTEAFAQCDQGNAMEVTDITDAINFCGIPVSEQDVVEASPGDLKQACLDEGVAQGISGADADQFIAAIRGTTSCAQLADALELACSN